MARRRPPALIDSEEILRVFALLAQQGVEVARASSIDIRTDGITLTLPQTGTAEGNAYDKWKNVDPNRAPPAHN
jgi:hypothetical protein